MDDTSFAHIPIGDAGALIDYRRHLPETDAPEWWLFRGTAKPWPLQTSLERVLLDADLSLAQAPDIERKLLKEFKRRAHHHLTTLPAEGDLMGWLALMQHHGAPTRLLDCTYSFYIAAFFALADAASMPPDERKPAVVWALYRNAFTLGGQAPGAGAAYDSGEAQSTKSADMFRPDADNVQDGIKAFLAHVIKEPQHCVWAVNSFRLNERVTVQRGLFLCPGDIRVPFIVNLDAGHPHPGILLRYELSTEPAARKDMLTVLHDMNIGYASLFPGLDGFARSLHQAPWIAGKLRPDAPGHR
jgi:hypothetical protein